MIFSEFKERLIEETNGTIHISHKVNRDREGILLPNSSALLYLDELYDYFREHSWEDGMAYVRELARTEAPIQSFEEWVKPENIIAQMVNKDKNMALLATVPYRVIGDLAVIYRLRVAENGTVLITNANRKDFPWSEPELFQHAVENAKGDVFVLPMGPGIYGITNSRTCMGAIYGFIPDLLQETRKALEPYCDEDPLEDFYIIPSSVHEVIVVVPSMIPITPEGINATIGDVNKTLKPEEYLSDHVYDYQVILANYHSKYL